jgi:ankyrin repeat protein
MNDIKNISILEAANSGNIEAIKQHLIAGTNLNERFEADPAFQNIGYTPLEAATNHMVNEEWQIRSILYRNKTGSADEKSFVTGQKEVVELLITNGADVRVADSDGDTPLHIAATGFKWALYGSESAIEDHKEVVKLLIANGADVNAKDEQGKTPLHNAAYYNQKETVELLITNGADVNATTVDEFAEENDECGTGGTTALHQASEQGNREIVELLISSGADVNAEMNDGSRCGFAQGTTPLDFAKFDTHFRTPEEQAERKETSDLILKHGGKSGTLEEFVKKAEMR